MDEFILTAEQKAIVDADLEPLAVVACPGSGKTATAVRRLAEVRRRLEGTRGYVALLSYSNVAVDTFRIEYQQLRGRDGASDKVVIQTVDSFITSYLLRPHGARVMKSSRTPYLVLGGEPFLSNYKFGDQKNPIGIDELLLDRTAGQTVFYRRHRNGGTSPLDEEAIQGAREKAVALGKVGGYTYVLGRTWALRLLEAEPRLAKALARRFPQILVDEAQDVGSFEGAILDLLIDAGTKVSLIGDFHQSIYGFNFATGAYLREFAARPGVLDRPLTQNRRSLPSIVDVANALASTNSKPFRTTAPRLSGTYYWRYEETQLPQLMSAWATALVAEKYELHEATVLCRGGALLTRLAASAGDVGWSAVKHFAAAAIEREQRCDIFDVVYHCAKGIQLIVEGLPTSFTQDLKGFAGDADLRSMRRLVWMLIRSPNVGIPSAGLAAKGSWQPALKTNLDTWLSLVEAKTRFKRIATWGARVTTKDLPEVGPLLTIDIGQNDRAGLRQGTVHSAKGEGIPAVMYLTAKKDLDAMLAGTQDEEGRIGYVAVTRARDLLVVAIPKKTTKPTVQLLEAKGFLDWEQHGKSSTVAVLDVAGPTPPAGLAAA